MPPPTLPDRFHTMMSALPAIPHLRLHRHHNRVVRMSAAALEEHLRETRTSVPMALPDDFAEALPIQEGTALAWSCEGCSEALDEEAGGEFFLEEFFSVVFSEPVPLDRPSWSAQKRRILAESRVFDDQHVNGNGRMTLLRMADAPELWFYRQGDLFRLRLSYRDYMARLCETRGFYDWQLFFVDPEDLEAADSLDGLEEAREILRFIAEALPVVFPGTDVAPLVSRLRVSGAS